MSLLTTVVEFLPLLEVSDIELILILDSQKQESIPRIRQFELKSLVDEFCKLNFRFYKDDILRLKILLRLNGPIICANGVKVGAVEALCITLRRLAYPNR